MEPVEDVRTVLLIILPLSLVSSIVEPIKVSSMGLVDVLMALLLF